MTSYQQSREAVEEALRGTTSRGRPWHHIRDHLPALLSELDRLEGRLEGIEVAEQRLVGFGEMDVLRKVRNDLSATRAALEEAQKRCDSYAHSIRELGGEVEGAKGINLMEAVKKSCQQETLTNLRAALAQTALALNKSIAFIGYSAHVPHLVEEAERAVALPLVQESLQKEKKS